MTRYDPVQGLIRDAAVGEGQPGKPLPNRADRRRWAREAARQLNRTRKRTVVAYQKED
jgi:hypothetical protein